MARNSISVTIAQLAINQSNQETDKILIQLWAFSLAAPIAQCRHSNLFSVSDDIQTDEKFDVSITLLHSDWLLISAVITAISCTVEIFYKPVINDTMPTSFSTTTSDLSSGNSWRIRRDGLRSSAPFMIGTDKVGIQKNSSNISIHLLQDGALLWNCPVSTGMYSPLLSNILLTRSNNITQFTDINQRRNWIQS
ncbi:hypothetical protein BDF19DRAFT_66664 [Syncephalis fuscata]|nr:hypothetical protein BDF19DRAFT_66664 [Syncephalis fuscata]